MTTTIRLLSDEVINQIAAGEVIESPASVVKELVENALDAGAEKIAVEVAGGGLQRVVVSDDGKGMDAEDAKLSIVRHATSKLTRAEDLFYIASKGFRGEALASIAAISKLTVETAQEGQTGTRLEVERGRVVKTARCARTCGTTFTVRNLFHNVPARKKFQKSPPALSAEIFRMMTVLALSHPSVQFELASGGKRSLQTRRGERFQERAAALLGAPFAETAFPLHFEEGSLYFEGLLGAPSEGRPNRMSQFLFLNGRFVQCDAIVDAIKRGYATRLAERRHPLFLLYLSVPPDLVDVNVHPQKLQVRLRKEELFRDKVYLAVEAALSRREERPAAHFDEPAIRRDAAIPFVFREECDEPPPAALPLEKETPVILDQLERFLLFKEGETLVAVDVEAATFRTCYEQLIAKTDAPMEKQGLLVPFNVTLTSVESAMVLTHQEAIEQMGFSLKAIGRDVFMVEAIPPFLKEGEVKGVLIDMAHALEQFIGQADYERDRRQALALKVASRAKVKRLASHQEARDLIERLSTSPNQTHCPKGNPIRIELSYDKIEDLFRADQKAPASSR